MRIRTLLTVASTLALGLGTAMALPGTPQRDCVVDVTGGAEKCFTDYRAAIAFATDGAITDAPHDAHGAVGEPAFRAEVARLAFRNRPGSVRVGRSAGLLVAEGNPVIGATLFTGTNYTGQSETLRIAAPCVKNGKYDYGFRLGTVGRHAKSAQPWANCWIWLHSGDSWSSPRQGPYTTDTPDLGDWKDRAVLMGLS